jgi:hypothetical protein
VAGVRQEARLHLVGLAQALGLVLDLGIQRDDAAVGVFQLARQVQQVFLALAQLGQRGHQLLVLLVHLEVAVGDRAVLGQLGAQLGQPARPRRPGAAAACTS